MTIHDLAKTVAISFDSEIKVNISNPQPFNKYIERYVPDTQRANSELGLQQIVKLQNAIEKTAQWKLSRGETCDRQSKHRSDNGLPTK